MNAFERTAQLAELGGIPFESFVAMQDKTWRELME